MQRSNDLPINVGNLSVIRNEENEGNLPVIKFHGMEYISNVDEIFKAVEWVQIPNSGEKERRTLAWLPKDKSMKGNSNDGKISFYGEIFIRQFEKDDCIYICQTDESATMPISGTHFSNLTKLATAFVEAEMRKCVKNLKQN